MIAFTKVKLPYGWLGNMAPYPVSHKRTTFRTSEALFQALRFEESSPIVKTIRDEKSPMAAKMVAKSNRTKMIVEPQSPTDLANMRYVIYLKLRHHPTLKTMLIDTGDEEIIEDVTARSHGSGLFWGAAKNVNNVWVGENHLGKIWMVTRNYLQNNIPLVP